MYTAGVDIGSRTSKAVIVNQQNKIIGSAVLDTGLIHKKSGKNALKEALSTAKLELSQLSGIIATGYGRVQADFADKTITEISCHAKGAHFINNEIRTIVDIGGQDSKVIKVNKAGRVIDFYMNDRCAAGTGKFLEITCRAMKINLTDFAKLYAKSYTPCSISSVCTVFAESEVISLLAEGRSQEDIVAGLHLAAAKRIANMALRLGVEEKTAFTGGVANNEGLVRALQDELHTEFCKLKYNPQLIGALGAAILAGESQ